MDFEKLRQYVADGVVLCREHPTLPLQIYNYSPRVQYEKLWDEIIVQCRGLVCHGETIVARPFRKFFNDTEHSESEIPWHLPCEVTEKMDGSLLIWFCFAGQWVAATRGSFVSEQAEMGRQIIEWLHPDFPFNPMLTYLFEVIYPGNRIVVDYGGRQEVVLLAAIDTQSGNEVDHSDCGLKTVRRLPPDSPIRELRTIIRDDEEGYVVRFANGFRMKVKGSRYMELHRVITGVSSRSIWEILSQGRDLSEVLDVAPDECADWIRGEAAGMCLAFDKLRIDSDAMLDVVKPMATRKDQALYLMGNNRDLAGAVFAMLDGKSCDSVLWKKLYPEFRRPKVAELIEA